MTQCRCVFLSHVVTSSINIVVFIHTFVLFSLARSHPAPVLNFKFDRLVFIRYRIVLSSSYVDVLFHAIFFSFLDVGLLSQIFICMLIKCFVCMECFGFIHCSTVQQAIEENENLLSSTGKKYISRIIYLFFSSSSKLLPWNTCLLDYNVYNSTIYSGFTVSYLRQFHLRIFSFIVTWNRFFLSQNAIQFKRNRFYCSWSEREITAHTHMCVAISSRRKKRKW